jgi:hypothetical protein
LDDTADTLDYAALIQDALRGMVRRVLGQVAEQGLPGEHHFYIGFRTDHPEVGLSGFLRDQNPGEMRIVLQNQFWDLEVDDRAFSVSLSFGGSRQRLIVPFSALTEFADPTAGLALRFEANPSLAEEPEEAEEPVADEQPEPERSGSVIRFDPSRHK